MLLEPRALFGPRADLFPGALEPERDEAAPLTPPLTTLSRSSDAGALASLRGVLVRALLEAPADSLDDMISSATGSTPAGRPLARACSVAIAKRRKSVEACHAEKRCSATFLFF